MKKKPACAPAARTAEYERADAQVRGDEGARGQRADFGMKRAAADVRVDARVRGLGGDRGMKKTKLACLLLLAALALGGCGKQAAVEAPELLPAAGVASDICAVRRGETSVPRAVDAWVSAYTEELSFPVNGVVGEVPVRAGDRVKAGDRLIVLDLDSVREQYEALKDEIDATRRVNDWDFRMAETDIAILESELSRLQRSGADARTVELKELDVREAEMNLAHDRETRALSLSRSEKTLLAACGDARKRRDRRAVRRHRGAGNHRVGGKLDHGV